LLLVILLLNSIKAASQLRFSPSRDSLPQRISLSVLPQNFYNQHLGFFCKKEALFQSRFRVPLFFRLGSKDYVDHMEAKPNTRLVKAVGF
jgi:hypothetical protein